MKNFKTILALCVFVVSLAFTAETVKITGSSKKTTVQVLKDNSFRVLKKFEFISVPDKFIGLQSIIAERGNWKMEGMGFTFNVDKPVTVYLFVDHRNKDIPKEWKKTSLKAKWKVGESKKSWNAGKAYVDDIYKKEFPAGIITIPASSVGALPHCAVVEPK